jgi:hypothetical protein
MAQNSIAEIELAQLQRVQLLEALYDLSNRNIYQPVSLQDAAKKIGIEDYKQATAAAAYLHSKGLFNFSGGGWGGRMTTAGIDMVEKWRMPKPKSEAPKTPPAIHFEDKSIRVSSSGHSIVQAGANNTQTLNFTTHIEQISKAIDESSATDESKKEAKNLLGEFLKHPLVTSIAGGIAGGLAARPN